MASTSRYVNLESRVFKKKHWSCVERGLNPALVSSPAVIVQSTCYIHVHVI